MKLSATLQNILLAAGATIMVAALFFLYEKTAAVDLRERNEVLATLRELNRDFPLAPISNGSH